MNQTDQEIILPVLPLKDMHIFPKMVMPVIVGLPESLEAIESSVVDFEGKILCLMQKQSLNKEYPSPENLYDIGFICRITQIIKMPDKKIRVLLCGEDRFKTTYITTKRSCLYAFGNIIKEKEETSIEKLVLKEKLISECGNYLRLIKNSKPDILTHLHELEDLHDILYFVCMNVDLSVEERQNIIAMNDFGEKARKVLMLIGEKSEFIRLQKSIDNQVYGKLTKMQREHFLYEQLKTIQKELGISADAQTEVLLFKEKIANLPLSEEAKKKTDDELKKLMRIPTHSPEYFVCYNYLSWVVDLPWEVPVIKTIDINQAEDILNQDHYGLEKIKERILEYLAVMQFNVQSKAQILCFIGPPGVGKTSLGKSIARALGREFIRLSVGGVTDESEIRGHRKTYIGSMPGIIIQSLKKAGTVNTLIMIDEIDKLGHDYKGDPSSALLEVLDPEQNNSFRDHYLDFGFDLSKVFFIATANNLATIPVALRDRMEIIKLSSYTEHEKNFICKDYLLPKKIKEFDTGKKLKINIPDSIIRTIIRNYTAEAGVRELERHVNALYRKAIKKHLKKEIKKSVTINEKILKEFLGVPIFSDKDFLRKDAVGIAYGLAWTPVGGDVLPVEVTKYEGNGKFQMTGNIGKVMNESAKAAMSLIRKNHKIWGIKTDVFKKYDLHVHIPEGAVPKDGPSAGVVLAMAIISVFANKPFDHTYAMTGEISLTGKILSVGGLTEKIVAAQRYGFKKVILPEGNKKDFEEIKPEAKENIDFVFADHIEKVVGMVLRNNAKL
ncbi:MAG: endopeptidase La [Candidatus Cloacimonetes bacterium]|nr:endopeptidase La [Candidatus Cloacimonadota bacterium]